MASGTLPAAREAVEGTEGRSIDLHHLEDPHPDHCIRLLALLPIYDLAAMNPFALEAFFPPAGLESVSEKFVEVGAEAWESQQFDGKEMATSNDLDFSWPFGLEKEWRGFEILSSHRSVQG